MLASTTAQRPTRIDELIPGELAAALDRLDVHTRKMFVGRLQGERRSKARGRGLEFADFREYAPGDDLRRIDWNVFARFDRLYLRLFLEEQDVSVHVVLDATASMDAGTPNKLLAAQRLAMSLGYIGLVGNNRVGAAVLRPPGAPWRGGPSDLALMPPSRGRAGVQSLARFLLDATYPGRAPDSADTGPIQARPPRTFAEQLRAFAVHRGQGGSGGKGVVVLISDLLIEGVPPAGGFESGLAYLAGDGWDVVVIQVLSPGELDPLAERDGSGEPAMLGDLRLTDAESGRAAEVTLTPELIRAYRRRLEAYQRRVTDYCRSRGIVHLLVRSDADIGRLLLDDLRRRGVLR